MTMMMDTQTDWRYSDDRMKLREQALTILLKRFGGALDEDGTPVNENRSIYECVHDWVSQGNVNCNGIIKYYEAYYAS